MIYIVQAADALKVGLTNNPKQRLSQIQISHHARVTLLHLFEGGREEEAALHQRFAAARLVGEWFKPVPELLAGDVGLPPVTQKQPPASTAFGMDRIKETRGLQSKIARDLGISTGAVAMWKKVPAERLPDVERASGIHRHYLRPDICPPPGQCAPVPQATP